MLLLNPIDRVDGLKNQGLMRVMWKRLMHALRGTDKGTLLLGWISTLLLVGTCTVLAGSAWSRRDESSDQGLDPLQPVLDGINVTVGPDRSSSALRIIDAFNAVLVAEIAGLTTITLCLSSPACFAGGARAEPTV